MNNIISNITNKDQNKAYAYTKRLITLSRKSDKYVELIPEFEKLLDNKSSYIRTRTFQLICAQARWLNEKDFKKAFKNMIPLLNDEKPTVVRQCLQALNEVMDYGLANKDIIKAVKNIDITRYKDSTAPLIKRDIEALLSKKL